MKKNTRNITRILKANNAVEPAASASVWGKGVPGKGGATLNFEIPEWMFKRELEDMLEGIDNA